MRKRSTAFAPILIAVLVTPALGDGKGFSKSTPVVRTPDQQALIAWQDGIETLVVETNLAGKGDEFAWVVPLPNVPEVSPATTGLFPTLRHLTQPRVIGGVPLLFWPITVFAVAIGLACNKHPWIGLSVFVVYGIYLAVAPKYTTGSEKSEDAAQQSVKVYARQQIGSYDTVTLSADNGDDLAAWLKTEGYMISPDTLPVIEQYTKEGWVFVAARITRHEDEDLVTPHPLIFKFAAAEPIYPLRLTGVDNKDCRIDLYIAGPGTAQAEGFTVKRCGRLDAPPPDAPADWAPRKHDIPNAHPLLRRVCGDTGVMTKLSATLEPQAMEDDLAIEWTDYRRHHPVQFAWDSRINIILNLLWGVFAALWLAYAVSKRVRRLPWYLYFLITIGVSYFGAMCSVRLFPGTDTVVRDHKVANINTVEIHDHLEDFQLLVRKNSNIKPTPDQLFKNSDARSHHSRLHEIVQDRPGGFTLNETDGKIIYTQYDRYARPTEHVIWPPDKEEP